VSARIAVVDYGMGNRRSVEKALAHVGADPVVTSDCAAIEAADGLVVPGVGAFPQAMRNLAALGLGDLIVERLRAGVPVLGICLGMQLAFESSEEGEGAAGLGILRGTVRPLRADGRRLPHIGWSEVRWKPGSALGAGLPAACAFYHVHTFAPVPADPDEVAGTAEYGEVFATAVQARELPFFGVQFHPEKSSAHGLALLEAFARRCAPVAA
jgi:glutamine amidotransferase